MGAAPKITIQCDMPWETRQAKNVFGRIVGSDPKMRDQTIVIEGYYEWAIDDQAAKTLKAGDTFYEPTGCLHRVSKNPGNTKTRVLAVVLHAHDTKQISTPEPKK